MARGLALTKNIALPLAQLAGGNTEEFLENLGSTGLSIAASLLPGGSMLAQGIKTAGKAVKIGEAVYKVASALGKNEEAEEAMAGQEVFKKGGELL